MPGSHISIPLPEELAQLLPADPVERQRLLQQVLVWGVQEWRIRRALESYQRGEGSLAYAARQAGVSLREMIPLAYAHGIEPRIDPADLEVSYEDASNL